MDSEKENKRHKHQTLRHSLMEEPGCAQHSLETLLLAFGKESFNQAYIMRVDTFIQHSLQYIRSPVYGAVQQKFSTHFVFALSCLGKDFF